MGLKAPYLYIDMENTQETIDEQSPEKEDVEQQPDKCYRIRFRPNEQICSAVSKIRNLKNNEIVMAQTDHGLEPAEVHGFSSGCACEKEKESKGSFALIRRGTRDEVDKYNRLIEREQEAFGICQKQIEKHQLPMKLIKVERFFNGSKIIFYFTAETRVDFRELVKDLVQEFRTRVEIRQIGVRHETKMIGGLGCCGRELCCSSFIRNFAPVSIKMAKEQGLPLNPSKISGICNRLLCCLTYEFDTYHSIRKKMPKVGKNITIDGKSYKVLKNNVLEETIAVVAHDDPENQITLSREEWQKAAPAQARENQENQPQGKTKKQKPAPTGGKK